MKIGAIYGLGACHLLAVVCEASPPTWKVGAISCWLKGWGSPQQTKYPTEMMGFVVVKTKADITFVRNALVYKNCLFGLDPESFIVPRLSEVLPSQGVNRIHQTQLLLQNKPLS